MINLLFPLIKIDVDYRHILVAARIIKVLCSQHALPIILICGELVMMTEPMLPQFTYLGKSQVVPRGKGRIIIACPTVIIFVSDRIMA